jgi:predicted RNase H-like nuclease (RuvC/YqgF family)
MNICSSGHDEIVYDNRDCPICVLKEEHRQEIDEKNSEIEKLKKENENLQEEVDNLKPDDTDNSGGQ